MNNDLALIRVVIIDDDRKLLDLLQEYLPRYQIEVQTETDAKNGLALLQSYNPDLVILDVLMPGMDGFEVCREIRRKSEIPILMLSARGESTDKIIGLELGADDYMAKPFDPRELVTRIHTILRRSGSRSQQKGFIFEDLEVRLQEREAYLGGRALELTSMEFELLSLFVQSPGRKFSRDEIMNHLQGVESGSFSRSVDILISRLRSKLGETARSPRFIKSVHGYGYVFTGETA